MFSAWRNEVHRPAKVGDGFIIEIESLRGIAIALVFLHHADCWVSWRGPASPGVWVSPLRAFVLGGHTGVTLFFVLSGFLLSRPFLREARGGPRVSRLGYYRRRLLRIYPLYFAVVVASSILAADSAAAVWRGLPYLVFLNSVPGIVSPIFPYDSVWWSLATEAQFYVLLPFVASLWSAPSRRRIGAGLLIVYATAYAAFAAGRLHMSTATGQWHLTESVFGRGPLFALGAAAAWVCDRYGERIREGMKRTAWASNGGADAASLGVLLCLALLLQQVTFMTYTGAELRWPAWHIIEGILWTALLLLLLLAPVRLKPLFSNSALSAIGLLSYSIYLIHDPLIVFCLTGLRQLYPSKLGGWGLMSLLVMVSVAALCLGMSAVTYWTIERPFLRRKVRISWWAAPMPAALRAGTTRPLT